eukprot:gene32486-39276_t
MENIVLDVGDEIPQFDLDSQLGRVYFREMIAGKWTLLVSFAHAFDPVITTDLGLLSKLAEEFEARVVNYRRWIREVEELQGVRINMALMSDPECKILKMLGCAREHLVTKKHQPISQGGFIIDLEGRIRFSSRCSLFIGRNWYEFLRQYDAIMMSTYHPIVCPANWGQGQQVLIKKDIAT